MEVNHNQKRGKKGTFSRVRKPIILAPFVCLATLAMLGVWCLSPSVLTVRAQTSSIKLSGQLPEIVKSSHAVSAVDENKQLDIVIGLRPRNQDALTNYVENNPAPQDPSARAAYAQKIEQAYDPLPSS